MELRTEDRATASSASNQASLSALAASRDQAERLALRNQLVQRNLPLVHAITARMGLSSALPAEDLRQIGSLGLLRAVEAFNARFGGSLSSFAVPYIRGAIQHELRDRASLVRVPRALWELRRRATALQDRRRRDGEPQLAPAALAEALDCSPSQLIEALDLGSVLEMRSLDAPAPADGTHEGTGRSLIDQVADPASLADERRGQEPTAEASLIDRMVAGAASSIQPGSEDDSEAEPADAAGNEQIWLQRRLRRLSELERTLVLGHVCCGRSWAELGRELGLHPRQAQRRTLALLDRLQSEGRRWRQDASGSDGRSPASSRQSEPG